MVKVIASLLIGGMIGAAAMWAAPRISFSNHDDVKQVVQAYLKNETNGRQKEALEYLTGEAKVIVSSQTVPIPDPLVKDTLQVITDKNDIAQVNAEIWTQKNRVKEQFFLSKQNGKWLINHVAIAPQSFDGLRSTQIDAGQWKVILNYVSFLAQGDVKNATQELVGNALIKAGKWQSTKIPKQTIDVKNVKPVGILPSGDVVIKADESINGVADQKEQILFTLTQLANGNWKIADAQLLSRVGAP